MAASPASAGSADSCLHATDTQGQLRPPSLVRLSPERAWWLAKGQGVTVAVIGSGVDARHPQLAGAVAPGRDVIDGCPADDDCDGSGAVVAGRSAGTSLAPQAPTRYFLDCSVDERAQRRGRQRGLSDAQRQEIAEKLNSRDRQDQGHGRAARDTPGLIFILTDGMSARDGVEVIWQRISVR